VIVEQQGRDADLVMEARPDRREVRIGVANPP